MRRYYFIIFIIILILIFIILFFKCNKEIKIVVKEKEIEEKKKVAPSAKEKIAKLSIEEQKKYNYEIFILKIDADGNCVFAKTFEGPYTDWADFIIQTKDGGYILAGRNYSTENSTDKIFIAKLNKNFEIEWNKTYDEMDREVKSIELKDGFLIIGKTQNVYLAKTDEKGNFIWIKTLGEKFYESGYYALNTKDGATMILGLTEDVSEIKTDVYLTKKMKDVHKNFVFGGNEYDWGYCLTEIKGGYLITGLTFSFGNGKSDVYLIKTDMDGNCVFAKTIGKDGYDEGLSALETKDGYLITGATTSHGRDDYDVLVVKTDFNGNLIWMKNFGYELDDIGYCIEKTDDNCYIIAGTAGIYSLKKEEYK